MSQRCRFFIFLDGLQSPTLTVYKASIYHTTHVLLNFLGDTLNVWILFKNDPALLYLALEIKTEFYLYLYRSVLSDIPHCLLRTINIVVCSSDLCIIWNKI